MSMWARTWAHTWARTCGRRNLDVISSAECLRSRSRRRSGRRQRRPLRASSGRPRSWASERGRCSLATDCGLTVRVWPKGLRATRIDHFQFLLLKQLVPGNPSHGFQQGLSDATRQSQRASRRHESEECGGRRCGGRRTPKLRQGGPGGHHSAKRQDDRAPDEVGGPPPATVGPKRRRALSELRSVPSRF